MPLPIRPHRDHSRDHLSGPCSARLVNRCNVNAPLRRVSFFPPPTHTFLFSHNTPNDSTKIGPVLIRFWEFLSNVLFSVSKFESGLIYYELWKFLSCHTIIQYPPILFIYLNKPMVDNAGKSLVSMTPRLMTQGL